ncbi:hypothetical protein NKH18_49505 [Streptomyces sp. M10(2022)]
MYHWGALIMSAGNTDGAFTAAGANPYGVSAPRTRTAWSAPPTCGRRRPSGSGSAAPPHGWPGQGTRGTIGPRLPALGQEQQNRGHLRSVRPRYPDTGLRDRGGSPEGGRRGPAAPDRSPQHEGGRNATPADVEWADAVAFGARALIGTVSPLLLQFLEECEPLRESGKLDGKAATGFVTTLHPHSGSESALLTLYNAMHHWGRSSCLPAIRTLAHHRGREPVRDLPHGGQRPAAEPRNPERGHLPGRSAGPHHHTAARSDLPGPRGSARTQRTRAVTGRPLTLTPGPFAREEQR